jgi:hypothetical protein
VLDDETEITAYCNPLRGVKETAGARLVSRRMVESGMEHRFVVGGFRDACVGSEPRRGFIAYLPIRTCRVPPMSCA